MDRAPQILLLSLQNTTAGPNQHNYKKIATFTFPAHEHIFPFLLPPWQKTQLDYGKHFTIHQYTTDKDKVVAHHNSFVNQVQYHPKTLLTYSGGS